MGRLLHLEQWGGAWAGCSPSQSPPRCTKCNIPPINGQCSVLMYNGPLLCSVDVPIKGFILYINCCRSGPQLYRCQSRNLQHPPSRLFLWHRFIHFNNKNALSFCSYVLKWILAMHNDNNNSKTMFMVLSSRQSHCNSSPGSFDECRTALSSRRPKTKPDDLGCESACTGCHSLHPPSPFIVITQAESWYSFYRRMEGRRLSRPSWLVTYRGGLAVHRRSPILVLTGSDVSQLHWSRPMRYH